MTPSKICKEAIVEKCCTKEFFVENRHLFSDDLLPVSEAQVIKNWKLVSKESGNGLTIRTFICSPFEGCLSAEVITINDDTEISQVDVFEQ